MTFGCKDKKMSLWQRRNSVIWKNNCKENIFFAFATKDALICSI